MATLADLLKTCDTVLTKSYDGSPEGLQSLLDALDLLVVLAPGQDGNQVTILKTRLVGPARDAISTETTIEAVKATLLRSIKRLSSKELTNRIEALKPTNPVTYAKEVESLAKGLKSAFIAEGVQNKTADTYVTDCVSKAISKQTEGTTKAVMLAGNFDSASAAVTKYLEVSSATTSSSQLMTFRGRNRNGNSRRNDGRNNNHNRNNCGNNRGRGRGNGRNRGSGQRSGYRQYPINGDQDRVENEQNFQQGSQSQTLGNRGQNW